MAKYSPKTKDESEKLAQNYIDDEISAIIQKGFEQASKRNVKTADEYKEHLKEIRPNIHKDNGKYKPTTSEELQSLTQDLSVNLGDIDTSAITDMSYLFYESKRQDFSGIEKWDTSSVTDMSGMFEKAEHFNADISKWNVSNLTLMDSMFYKAESFNQSLDSWNVSNILEIDENSHIFDDSPLEFNAPKWYSNLVSVDESLRMFDKLIDNNELSKIRKNVLRNSDGKYKPLDKSQLQALLQDSSVNLGDIDTSAIEDMSQLFYFKSYKIKRKDFSGIEKWNVSSVKTMNGMFYEVEKFNVNINDWNVSNVEDMSFMFGFTEFNQPLDKWNVSNVEDMSGMFQFNSNFNQDLSDWSDKLGKVKSMAGMFMHSFNFNQPLNSWNVSSVTNMAAMFSGAKSFNQPLDSWDTSSVTDMGEMFEGTDCFNQPLDSWNVSSVIFMSGMFKATLKFNQPLDSWNVSNVVDMSNMFDGAVSFNQDLSDWGDKLGKVKSMDSMFEVTPSLAINFLSVWQIPEYCTKENMTQHSRLESDESKLIPSKLKPNECVYRITQVECDLNNIKDFRLSENNKIKFLEEWIPKNILKDYNIFFAKAPHKKNDDKSKENKSNFKIYAFDDIEKMDYEGSRDGWLWDFAFYEVLGYKFMVEKGNNILANGIKRTNISFEIQIKDIDIAKDKKYNSNTKFYDNKLSISFSNQTMIVWIQKGSNQNDILDILNVYMIAKAYNTKMDELGKNARDANEKRKTINAIKKPLDKWLPFSKAKQANKKLYDELKKSYEEVCNFDLHSYHNIPIVQVDKSALMAIWQDISQKYMVQDKHDELKETISRVTQLVSDERQENLNYIMYWVAILSAIAAIFSAIPILQNFIAWISSKI